MQEQVDVAQHAPRGVLALLLDFCLVEVEFGVEVVAYDLGDGCAPLHLHLVDDCFDVLVLQRQHLLDIQRDVLGFELGCHEALAAEAVADFANFVDSLEEDLVVEPAALRHQLQVLVEGVRRDAHHALVRRAVMNELQWHLQALILLVALGVLHVAHDSALLLPQIVVVVDLPQKRAEAARLLVRLDLGAVFHHLVADLRLDLAAQVSH